MLERSAFKGSIYVVDEDAAARQLLSATLADAGYEVTCFADAIALLSEVKAQAPVCIILETKIADRSGLEILKRLRHNDCPSPILMASADGDIPTAVDAIRNGASDFIQKPFRSEEIVARINAAIGDHTRQSANDWSSDLRRFPNLEPLTRREREVLARIAAGDTNKETARQLGLSTRTVEGYRASIMKKAGARNATELVRLVFDQDRDS